MRVVVTCEARFGVSADGRVWTKSPYHYEFWTRYLTTFDEVRVVARAGADDQMDDSWKLVGGPQVSVVQIPYYLGPREFVLKRGAIRRALVESLGREDALLCRVGSPLATELLSSLRGKRPYGLEVVGDPDQALAPGTV